MPWARRLLRNEGIPVLPHQEHGPAVPRTAGAFLRTQSRLHPPPPPPPLSRFRSSCENRVGASMQPASAAKKKKKNNNSNNKIVDRSSSGRFSHDLIPMVFVKNPLMQKSPGAISETRFRESELAVFWCSFLLLSFVLFLSFPRLSLVIPALLHTQTLYAHITRRVTRVTQFITTERGATFLVAPRARAQPQARVSLLIASGTRS